MKLCRLEIENYGIFSGNKAFEFSDGGFQLVHGPNEAGKSTLLQLIREVFFGFGTRNPYAFSDHSGEMAATASIELSDGRAVTFRRRKGTKNVVAGQVEGGTSVDEAELGKMLGQANVQLYQHVFGFSLAELVAGEKSLKDANVNEALYGGGMGGLANFQEVQAALKKEHEGLFKSRGTTLPVNKLLKSIKDADTAVGKATVKPRDYKELCQKCDESETTLADLRAARDSQQLRFSRAERLHKALRPWLRRSEAEGEVAALSVPAGILNLPDAEKDYRRTLEAIDAISGELVQEQNNIEAARARLEDLRLEPKLIEDTAAAAIKSLERGLEQIERFREDLPKRIQEAGAIRYSLGQTAARLNPDWDIGFLENFNINSAQSEAIDSIAQETRDLENDKKHRETQIKEMRRKLAAETRRLDELKAAPASPVLAQLAESAGQYKSDLQNLSELNDKIAETALKIDDLRGKLTTAVDIEAELLDKIPVPLSSKINEFSARFSESQQQLSQARANMESAETEFNYYRQRLASVDARQKIPDRQILVDTRNRRDAAWELIRRTWIDEADTTEEILQWLADMETDSDPPLADANPAIRLVEEFRQAIAAADDLADQRQENAKLVAAREQMVSDTERLENNLIKVKKIHNARMDEIDALQRQWREVWTQCRFQPDTPEVMRQWLSLHEGYFERVRDRKGLEFKRAELQHRIDGFERQLRLAMENEDDSPLALVEEARRQVELSRDTEASRRHLESELPSSRQEIEDLTDDLEEIENKREQCREQLHQTLDEIGFPTEWDAPLADKVLKELQAARGELQKALDLDPRIADMRQGIADYENRVHRACESLAPELSELPAEGAAAQLAERLDKANQAQHTHAELTKTIDDAQRREKAKSTQLESLQHKLQHFRENAEVESDEDFFRVASDARTKIELQKEIEDLTREIKAAAETEDIDAFHARLAEADTDSLLRELKTAQEELTTATQQYEQAAKDVGAAQTELKRLDSRSEAVEAAATLESLRAELGAAVDRWAPLVLAESLMNGAIARFEREHQPEMLQSVSELFSEMTLGRYLGVRRRLDESDTLLAEAANGSVREPTELSTGTREQLYLAIRLAYVRHYCRGSEPLPLVMDDVLVNFDDARAAQTLDVLIKIASDLQIIFLTCHRQTAELICSRLPEMNPIELG